MVPATYRSNGPPAGLSVTRLDAANHDHTRIVSDLRSGPLWNELEQRDPALYAAASTAPSVLMLRGTITDPANLDYLGDTIGFVQYLLDHGGVAVLDSQIHKVWSQAAWRDEVFAAGEHSPQHHVVIVCTEAPGGLWFHTRGMRKFGRPDLSVHDTPLDKRDAVEDLLRRFIEVEALGHIIQPEQQIRVEALPAGMSCHLCGGTDDPDFDNEHIEIKWPADTPVAKRKTPVKPRAAKTPAKPKKPAESKPRPKAKAKPKP